MPLFRNNTQFKAQVGGGANVSLELASIAPTLVQVAERYLKPWLGKLTYDELKTYIAATSPAANAALDALLPYAQSALAALGLEAYSVIATVQLSEAGIFRIESDERKTPYKYQENAYRRQLRAQGMDAIERMLDFLEANKDDYPNWKIDARPRARGLFINSAAELREVYASYVDRATFEAIRPILVDVEAFIMVPSVGQAQYDALKTLVRDGIPTAVLDNAGHPVLDDDGKPTYSYAPLAGVYLEAIQRIQKCVGLAAINEAMRRQWVMLRENQLIQVEGLEPQTFMKEGVPNSQAIDLSAKHLQEFSERNLSYALKYLADHPTEFPAYATFLADAAAAQVADTAAQSDAQLNDFWGYGERRMDPYLFGTQTYTPSTGTGIKRL
jgi:hypothetical protein